MDRTPRPHQTANDVLLIIQGGPLPRPMKIYLNSFAMRATPRIIRSSIFYQVVLLATLVKLCGSAAANGPTVPEAHSYLSEIFQAGGARFRSTSLRDLKVTGYYSDTACESTVNYLGSHGLSGSVKIRWSNITGVDNIENWLDMLGAIDYEIGSHSGTLSSVTFVAPDDVTAKRMAHASNLLMNYCNSGLGSKFN
jgi:hypothetical protein